MTDPLNLFPVRVAIVDPKTGLMTREFYRALQSLLARVGGEPSDASADENQFETFAQFAPGGDDISGAEMAAVVMQPAQQDHPMTAELVQAPPRIDPPLYSEITTQPARVDPPFAFETTFYR